MAGRSHDLLVGEHAVQRQLQRKSGHRRKELLQLTKASAAPHARRNDPLPQLELVSIGLDDLKLAARKIRKCTPAHVRELMGSISELGFCAPILVGKDNLVLDGEIRIEAAKALGLPTVPCIRIDHLTDVEQRTLRLALNRLGEKGQWDLRELKIEFEELILIDAPIEISGFSLNQIDQIILGDEEGAEKGPLAPESDAVAVARLGHIFRLGKHRIICGDATDPAVVAKLMDGDSPARLVLTDEPYNVAIARNVTRGVHREFLMASGEMSDAEFRAFNDDWMSAALPWLCDGGVFGTFIDWRGYPTVFAAASKLALNPLNLIVWTKTNAGMGSLYRSQHELLPLFKKGYSPHVNNIELGRKGRWRSNVWTYPGASSINVPKTPPSHSQGRAALIQSSLKARNFIWLGRSAGARGSSDCQATDHAGGRSLRSHQSSGNRTRPFPRVGLHPDRRRENRSLLPRRRARSNLHRCHPSSLPTGNR